MSYVLAIMLTLVSVLISLMLLTILMASGANSTPEYIKRLKVGLLAVVLVQIAGGAGALWTLLIEQPTLAAIIGSIPGAFCIVVFTVWVYMSGRSSRLNTPKRDAGW